MIEANFTNPLLNPIFYPVVFKAALIFIIGFLLLFAFKKFNFSNFLHSNLGKRYIGWLILAPIYLLGIFLGGIPGLIVLFMFMYMAIREIATIASLPKAYILSLSVLALCSIVVVGFFVEYFYSLPLLYFMVLTIVAIKSNNAAKGLHHVAISLFISIWIIFGLSHIFLLGYLNADLDNTRALLFLIIFATSFSDIGAYVVGKFFHKINFLDQYKVASNISPNKTYVGLIGHTLGAIGGIWVLYFVLGDYLPLYQWAIVSVLIGVFGLVGGLTNSMLKRFYNTKDSSHLIPGHGGVLDRIDSMTHVVIVLYYYFLFFS